MLRPRQDLTQDSALRSRDDALRLTGHHVDRCGPRRPRARSVLSCGSRGSTEARPLTGAAIHPEGPDEPGCRYENGLLREAFLTEHVHDGYTAAALVRR